MNLGKKSLVVAAVMAIGSSAWAATVNATFSSVSPGRDVKIKIAGQNKNTRAGVSNFTNATASDNDPFFTGTFSGFCIDLLEVVSYGYPGSWTKTTAIDTAPLPYSGFNPPGGMGVAKANDLRKLWGRFRALANTNDGAAAFQLAVWEIVYETASSYDINANAGNFSFMQLLNGAATYASIVTTANAWLADLANPGLFAGNLVALVNGSTANDPYLQDFLTTGSAGTQIVPLPPAVLAGAALMAVGGVIRRRKA